MNRLYKSERRKCLSNFMLLINFDVICICETWLTTDVNDSELFLAIYTIFRSDRVSKLGATSHGGTMICVINNIYCEEILTDFDNNGSITAWSMKLGMLNVCLICVYMPPADSNYAYAIDDSVRLFNFIQCQQKKLDELVIYGDFNFSCINWKTMSSEKSSATTFLSLMEKNNLLQLITFYTCATGILDLILVTKGVSAVTLEILPNYESLFNISNHFPILFTLSLQCTNWQRTSPCLDIVYSFFNADFDRFKELIDINPFNSYCWSYVDILVDQWYKWLEKLSSKLSRNGQNIDVCCRLDF